MAQMADTLASPSALSSWFDYLTTPAAGGPEAPTPERFVLAAVLADESIVKIDDNAQWYPESRVYRSTGAKVELSESMRGIDQVFTTDSGLYRIMTAEDYAEAKSVEAARAEAAASAAVSSPRATRTSTPTPSQVETGISKLSLSAASTGCGAHAKMVTLVAVGPTHIRAALKRAAPVVEQARRANNEIVTVVLGVADEVEAEEALRISGRAVLLAGANELNAVLQLKNVVPSTSPGPMRAYLRRAVLLDCVAGSAAGTNTDGGGGAWVLPVHPVPLDALPPWMVKRGGRGLVEWKDLLNRQWREWYARFELRPAGPLIGEDTALLTAYTSFPTAPRHPPIPGLPANATAVVGLQPAPPFGLVDHTIRWSVARGAGGAHRAWPEPAEQWTSTGGGHASIVWTITTWCGSMRAALRASSVATALDLHTDEDELQAEVETTLVSLLTYEAAGGVQPFLTRFDDLKGALGPVVFGGREGAQPMRATWWTVPDRTGGVLMLLPEAYVQMAMKGYPLQAPTTHSRAFLCAQSLLVLADADALPMRFEGVEPGEYDAELRAFGKRLWIPNGATEREAREAVSLLDGVPKAAEPLPTHRLQRDADQASARVELSPGQRVPTASARTVYYTSTSSDDGLSGLRVRWTRRAAAPHLPTLDVDSGEGGTQLAYETFV